MSSRPYGAATPAPPRFEDARNIRQRVRAAGLHPDHWYPAEWSRALAPGEVREVVFWNRSFALFRTEAGEVHCVDNRCAHRQLKLSVGHVEGCTLVCPYHGWAYDGAGRVVEIPHDLFGKKMPRFKLQSLPVQERYGIVWIFPGEPAKASQVHLPVVPELEGPRRWASVQQDFTWRCHHSMVIDNVSDFSHAYLHRRFRPFEDAKLTRLETLGDAVHLSYATKVGRGRFSGLFVDHGRLNTRHMDLCYEYPYQWSNTADEIKHWLFLRPIDRRTTRAFFVFYFKNLKVPLVPLTIPRRLMQPLMEAARPLLVKPLLAEDGFAVEAEQEGWEAHWDAPLAELNPAVRAFQEVTVRRWQAYLDEAADDKALRRVGA